MWNYNNSHSYDSNRIFLKMYILYFQCSVYVTQSVDDWQENKRAVGVTRQGRERPQEEEERLVLTTRPCVRRGGSLGASRADGSWSQVMSGYESSNKEKHAGSLNPCHTVVSLGLLSVPKTTLHPSLLFFHFSSVERSFQSQHEKQPHWSGAAGAPEQWKWMFCHLLSLRCHTRVSSDWLERGLPWPSTYWVKRM